MPTPTPTALRKDGDDHLLLIWDDGTEARLTWQLLREACPCASCNEERAAPPNPFRIVRPEEIAAGPPRPTSMSPVGHYAYRIVWNDGHDTGIYPLQHLYRLCKSNLPSEKNTE